MPTTNRHNQMSQALLVALTASCLALGAVSSSVQVQADTLNGALARAYKYNPRIDAERARLRATDEGVTQARSGYRPTITGNADISGTEERSR